MSSSRLRNKLKRLLFIFFKKNQHSLTMHFLTSRLKSLILCALLPFGATAQAKIDLAPILASLPSGSSVGLIAKNLHTGEIIAEHQAQTLMLPASTQKILTAIYAKLSLGDDFRFQTALLSNGKIQHGVLHGDLIAQFSGDPTLTSGQLSALIGKLKAAGINEIRGNLILDTAVFHSHDKGLGGVWNDLTMCFAAPAAAVSIDGNCFFVTLHAQKNVGELIQVEVPNVYPIHFSGTAYIADKKHAGHCVLDVVAQQSNHYQLKGCYAKQEKPFGLSFAVQDPTAYAGNILKAQLKRHGIKFNGAQQTVTEVQQGNLLAEHFSEPLPTLLHKMMKKSDNHIADALFRRSAYAQNRQPVSFSDAATLLRQMLQRKAAINLENTPIADGSGLSHYNLIRAQSLLQALEYLDQNEAELKLLDSFPKAGVDGTLAGRSSLAAAELTQNISAKTGTLKGVYNLAGFMHNAKGEKIAFVQLVNGYTTGEALDQKPKRAALHQFEQALYQALYHDENKGATE